MPALMTLPVVLSILLTIFPVLGRPAILQLADTLGR